jgi:hypothetical protein
MTYCHRSNNRSYFSSKENLNLLIFAALKFKTKTLCLGVSVGHVKFYATDCKFNRPLAAVFKRDLRIDCCKYKH